MPQRVNQTDNFAMAAEHHERIALKHEAAADDLLLAEADACRALPADARSTPPDISREGD